MKNHALLLPLGGIASLVCLVWLLLLMAPYAPPAVFTTINGQIIRMAQLKGRPVLVNFWATTCSACVEEMPKLVQTYNTYHQSGLELIAVAMPYDPASQVNQFATTYKLPFPVALDSTGILSHQFGDINLTPTTFLYDKEGKQIQRYVGTLDFAKLQSFLKKELQHNAVD